MNSNETAPKDGPAPEINTRPMKGTTSVPSGSPVRECGDPSRHGCVVCGKHDVNLSTLGRCWPWIKTAGEAWERKVAAEREAARDLEWETFWAAYPKPWAAHPRPYRPSLSDLLWTKHEARRAFKTQRRQVRRGPRHLDSENAGGAARRRLIGLVETVRGAQIGERNAKLYWAACRVGEMIAAGELDTTTGVAVLQDVATHVGLSQGEAGDAVHGTIGSGLRAGIGGVA